MASAKTNTVTKTEVIVDNITLTLTPREAVVLHQILANVGGCPTTSLRKETQAMYNALGRLGIYTYDKRSGLGITGRIYCNDFSENVVQELIAGIRGIFDIRQFDTPELASLLRTGTNAIAWIKLFRELTYGMAEAGKFVGLKESKDEYDRRRGDRW